MIRWLRRSLRAPFAVILLSLPLVFCLPGFLRGRTILPTDQVSHFAPCSASSSAPASEVANSWRGHGPHLPGRSLGFVTTFFPTAFGDDLAAPQLSIAPFKPPEMMLAYFGAVGWALGLLILRPGSARQRPEIALLLPMLFGLAVATGAWPVFEGLLSIPLLRLISPPRCSSLSGMHRNGEHLGADHPMNR